MSMELNLGDLEITDPLDKEYNDAKIVLHVCCGPCSTHAIEELNKDYEVVLFFSNSCIAPVEEYEKRLEEVRKLADIYHIELIEGDYDHEDFVELIKGHEDDKEGGERCRLCMEDRLLRTAAYAKAAEIPRFTTTLTISPHKNSKLIFELGKEAADAFKIKFIEKDFKKDEGFNKSVNLSKEHGIYRQDYCGCEFSMKR